MGDTPGWRLTQTDFVEIDKVRGIKLLKLKRSERRMKQTSFTMLQSWRANCDIALLIYTQNPLKINEKDIAAISGYVTSYCTKGNATHPAEVEAVSTMVLSMTNDFAEGQKIGTLTAVRKILNSFNTHRIISKAETSCDILKLPLYKCTEQFRTIPLNYYTKILGNKRKRQACNKTNILTKYAKRKTSLNMNLHDYFYELHKPKKQKRNNENRLLKTDLQTKQVIAHPTGLQNCPSYPITWQYAKAALILYKPWHTNLRLQCDSNQQACKTNTTILSEYYSFLREENCPNEIKLEFEIAKETFQRSLKKRLCSHNEDGVHFETNDNITEAAREIIEAQNIFKNQIEKYGFDIGLEYAWHEPTTSYDPNLDDEHWIDSKKEEFESIQSTKKTFPTKENNQCYSLEDIENNDQQANIVYSVIDKIKEWIEFEQEKSKYPELTFHPLYLTIQGAGGTGKSRTINVIVTIIEQLFPTEIVSIVSAPTGAAAYNIGGSTCHKQFQISVANATKDMSQKSKIRLLKILKHILILIIDERSLLSMETLGAGEKNVKECCHNGFNNTSDWGKIPVILLIGDDYQLPSVVVRGRGKGSSYILNKDNRPDRSQKLNNIEKLGLEQFLLLSRKVIELKVTHRVQEGEDDLSSMLYTMRHSKGLTHKQATKLLTYNIQNDKITIERKKFLYNEAIWIFHTNAQVDEHNFDMMKTIVNEKNPICNCIGFYSPAPGCRKEVGIKGHFSPNDIRRKNSSLARGARVALDRNLWDCMGLYNGAMGTIVDIRFETGKSPLQGDLPIYTIIDFDNYKGPPWITSHPTYLPIPAYSIRCRHKCCLFTKMPLTLSWARTTHKFQGSNVGPSHPIKAMVFDPGKSSVEGLNPGFTYVGLSRVSSLGQGNINESAFYLTGEHLTMDRFTNLSYQRTRKNEEYVKLQARNRWIKFLQRMKEKTNMAIPQHERNNLKQWIETSEFSSIQLDNAIVFHSKT